MSRLDTLIVGASGLVGRALAERLGEGALGTCNANRAPGLQRLDITDAAAVKDILGGLRPRAVIHAAAYADVNGCETDPERSYAVNVLGTVNVARAAARVGARYVFISTDYVFGGGAGPHRLGEPIAPLNTYGRHKAEAEAAVAEALEDHAILRACNLYGYQPGGKNFVQAVVELGRAGKSMRVPIDQKGNPTYADDIAAAVEAAAWKTEVRGTLHIAGPDYVDRFNLALRVAEFFGLDPGFIEGVATAELGQAAPRPLFAGLDAGGSERTLGVRFRSLDQGLRDMRVRMQELGGSI